MAIMKIRAKRRCRRQGPKPVVARPVARLRRRGLGGDGTQPIMPGLAAPPKPFASGKFTALFTASFPASMGRGQLFLKPQFGALERLDGGQIGGWPAQFFLNLAFKPGMLGLKCTDVGSFHETFSSISRHLPDAGGVRKGPVEDTPAGESLKAQGQRDHATLAPLLKRKNTAPAPPSPKRDDCAPNRAPRSSLAHISCPIHRTPCSSLALFIARIVIARRPPYLGGKGQMAPCTPGASGERL